VRSRAARKTVADTDLEQGGNTNTVLRRDLATGELTVLSSTAGAVPDGPRARSRMCWPMLDCCEVLHS
jgi:hypothetical protein